MLQKIFGGPLFSITKAVPHKTYRSIALNVKLSQNTKVEMGASESQLEESTDFSRFGKATKSELQTKITRAKLFTKDNWITETSDGYFYPVIKGWKDHMTDVSKIFSDDFIQNSFIEFFKQLHDNFLLNITEVKINPILDICPVLLIGVISAQSFGRRCFENGIVEKISRVLQDKRLILDSFLVHGCYGVSVSTTKRIFGAYSGILYNILKLNKDLRVKMRDLGTYYIIQTKLNELVNISESESLDYFQFFLNMSLAYMSNNGSEKEQIASIKIIKNVIPNLRTHLSRNRLNIEYNIFDISLSVLESLEAIDFLAKQDRNKKLLIQFIPQIFDSIKYAETYSERKCAVECLYTLSFDVDCNEKIRKEEEKQKILNELPTKEPVAVLMNLLQGLLIELGLCPSSEKEGYENSSKLLLKENIVIDFHENDEEMVKNISSSIEKNDLKVKLMSKNDIELTSRKMFKIIDDAAVFVVCLSRHYEDSNISRSGTSIVTIII